MLYWTMLFFIISIILGLFGFGSTAASTDMARGLFYVFASLFLVTLGLILSQHYKKLKNKRLKNHNKRKLHYVNF